MSLALRGHLISRTFASSVLPSIPGAAQPEASLVHLLDQWAGRCERTLGPASSVRTVTDVAVIPLLRLLGLAAIGTTAGGPSLVLLQARAGTQLVPVIVTPYGEPLDRVWRAVVLDGVRFDSKWGLCCNGQALRIVDASRTWSRHYLEFDLNQVAVDDTARAALWSLGRADALAQQPPTLDVAVDLSARHGAAVCRSLGRGVLQALGHIHKTLAGRSTSTAAATFDQSLSIIYRVLFLLFAEARGLVPVWHAVYRDRYSIDTIVSSLIEGRSYRGIWQALQAISRLVYAGCAAGDLRVTAFNGRLFAASRHDAGNHTAMTDDVIANAVLAIGTTSSGGSRRERISYRDLDVEQLGAVYEHILEHAPVDASARPKGGVDARKASSTFYTPRPLTSWLVSQTLEPLVTGKSAEDILRLRIVDPAMGSGAFLVGACRFLATALEDALVREGRWSPGDITAGDRVRLRREVAQRCLFGVDLNPTAVQLARLSLWLATLAADKPLSFLDHRLVAGDSLVGAALADVMRQPAGLRSARRIPDSLPLFDAAAVHPVIQHAVRTRQRLALEPDDSAAIVRAKEKALAALEGPGSSIAQWRRVLDLWCSCWFWESGTPPAAGIFAALSDQLRGGVASLPAHISESLLRQVDDLASRHAFLHWPLAFPEIFNDDAGEPRADAGFDAVLGNPPWNMVRGDSGDDSARTGQRANARRMTGFIRHAGIYRVESGAHINRYQLFVERALQLVRPGGRIGLVVPGGIAIDAGTAGLRRHLFERADLDALTGFVNRSAIFPIHRSVRFAVMTGTAGRPTSDIACRFGLGLLDELDRPGRKAVPVSIAFLKRLSGPDDLGIPQVGSERDLAIVEKLSARFPWLSSAEGWDVKFSRELNASDDRPSMVPYTGRKDARPVLEGKQIEPFRVSVDGSRYELVEGPRTKRFARRSRLAYRDVASPDNRLTLIAALVPAAAVTSHTLFCLKSALSIERQHVLCALLNSFVANYVVRMRVSTHVTVSLVARLPVPAIRGADSRLVRLAHLSRGLHERGEEATSTSEYCELQAIAAALYELTADEFEHILQTFPLMPEAVRTRTLSIFRGY